MAISTRSAHDSARTVERRRSPNARALGTKQQLADHLSVTRRWIELQQPRGLPYLRMGSMNRYRISDVEVWLHEYYDSPAYKEN